MVSSIPFSSQNFQKKSRKSINEKILALISKALLSNRLRGYSYLKTSNHLVPISVSEVQEISPISP